MNTRARTRPDPEGRIPLSGWRMTPPRSDESVRWECLDGRWVSIALLDGGRAALRTSSGRGEVLASFDAALRLADRMRILEV